MSDYRIGSGHGVAYASLVLLTPQPKGRPVRPTERTSGLTSAFYDQALYTEWLFGPIANSTEYAAILTQMGLASADWADMTVWTRDDRLVYVRYNCRVLLPEMGRDGDFDYAFMNPVTFPLVNLEAL